MKKQTFSGHSIFSTKLIDTRFDINNIILEFNSNQSKYKYTHFINKRCENIYLSPTHIPSILPLLSSILSMSIELYQNTLKPHQTLIIPHELLGYKKNEYWFNSTTKGQKTAIHNHNEKAIISGVYYLQVPHNSGNLFFKNEFKEEIEIESKKGEIIFFPSMLDHYVSESLTNENRLSLSFNCYTFPLVASVDI